MSYTGSWEPLVNQLFNSYLFALLRFLFTFFVFWEEEEDEEEEEKEIGAIMT